MRLEAGDEGWRDFEEVSRELADALDPSSIGGKIGQRFQGKLFRVVQRLYMMFCSVSALIDRNKE